MIVLEMECMNLSLGKTVKIVSPTCFENVAWTHARVSYSILRLMVVHFE